MTEVIALCLLGGSAVGFLNGLLGIGGMFIIIPLLGLILPLLGVPPALAHIMAIGTAPSTAFFSCVSSFLTHRSLGSVRDDILLRMGAGVTLGALAGAFLAPRAPENLLKLLFACVLLLIGGHMIIAAPRKEKGAEALRFLIPAGLFLGLIGSLTGLAGTLLTLTFLNWRGVSLRQSIGTSSGIGLILTIITTTGYIVSGWNAGDLPRFSLGYVYVPAFLCLLLPTVITARLGARLLAWKKLPLALLKRCLGFVFVLIAVRMAWPILFN